MNKRQAKKAFKKKYGVNPNQLAKKLTTADFAKAIQGVTESILKFAEELPRILQDITDVLCENIDNFTEQAKRWQSGEITEEEKQAIIDGIKGKNGD